MLSMQLDNTHPQEKPLQCTINGKEEQTHTKENTRIGLLVLQKHILKRLNALQLLEPLKLILKPTQLVQQLTLLKHTRKINHCNAQLMVLPIPILKKNTVP